MNHIYKLYILLIVTIGMNTQVSSQVDKIMSYNIRYDNHKDGINKWDNRKIEILALVNHYKPDIFGIQEGLVHQLHYLDDNLSSYSRIGVGRDDGNEKGEFCAIYYNNEKLSVTNESTFWLSQTSDRISIGWDASMERICTYGLFTNKITKQKGLVFNTHYDHIGNTAREESSRLILKKIKQINTDDYPVILMGDFNAEPNSKPISIIEKEFEDGATVASNGIYGPIGTYTGFQKQTIPERRIDYIFVKGLKVMTYRHIDDRMKNNNYLSDHLPVFINVEIIE